MVWKDPDFDPAQPAFYYARVIEIPTPRWTAYDAFRMGAEVSEESQMQTQERADAAPICKRRRARRHRPCRRAPTNVA